FMSQGSPTGYDNRDARLNAPDAEVYLYEAPHEAQAGKLVCASCRASGTRPEGVPYEALDLAAGGQEAWESVGLVAASEPGYEAFELGVGGGTESNYQPRYLADSGRLYFNSADALVRQDTNGTEDVYQYEPQGAGACTKESESFAASAEGCVNLISSGSSAQESAFLDASETGADVFFLSAAQLTGQDKDASLDVYDAHECTEASPCVSVPSETRESCQSEAACRPAPSLQAPFPTPASSAESGNGNLEEVPPAPASASTSAPKKSAAQLRAQALTKALGACHKKHRRARKACEANVRRRLGARGARARQSAKR
ncbi:MAG: hypothetical protein ACHQHO_13730, partial [Solirubrobacterales bacterium]